MVVVYLVSGRGARDAKTNKALEHCQLTMTSGSSAAIEYVAHVLLTFLPCFSSKSPSYMLPVMLCKVGAGDELRSEDETDSPARGPSKPGLTVAAVSL